MLPDGVDREHLLEVAGGCLLAPFDDDAIEVLRVLADPTKCRVELSTAAFRGDECPPEVPCAPGCPRCAGRGGFHAALAKLMPAKPPPPPASNDVPATWAPFSSLATRRPAESPQIEPRFGTEHWTAPVPPGLLEAWSTCDDWPALGLPAPNALWSTRRRSSPGRRRRGPRRSPTKKPTPIERRKPAKLSRTRGGAAPAARQKKSARASPAAPTSRYQNSSRASRPRPTPRTRLQNASATSGSCRGPSASRASHALRPGAAPGAAAPAVADAATLQLVSALVADAVAEDLYPATVAGLDYTISAVLDADALALSLKCGGFDEKVPALFDALLRGVRRAADEVVEPRAFAAAKSEVALSLENAWHDADRHARRLRLCCLAPGQRFSPAQRRAALQSVDAVACQRRLRAFLDDARGARGGRQRRGGRGAVRDASLRTVSTVAAADLRPRGQARAVPRAT